MLAVVLIGLVVTLDWNLLMPRLMLVAAMPYVMYRSTLVLPGPIRRAAPFDEPRETSRSRGRRRSRLQV
jgi:hypothetical protein